MLAARAELAINKTHAIFDIRFFHDTSLLFNFIIQLSSRGFRAKRNRNQPSSVDRTHYGARCANVACAPSNFLKCKNIFIARALRMFDKGW